ncbi:MAG TPA: MFS transporter [Rhizomicrobium sp.]|nr:MFS transporter [Rhizomicrobium sp.]
MALLDAAPQKRSGLTHVIAASSAGTIFEWYDFFLFGSLAAIIAKHFFASAGETEGFILALLTFAAGFFARPFGAIVFGHFGDLTGRKRTFLITVATMGLATFAIGFLPGESVIGVAAPWLLVLLRVIQGFAVGGEYGGAAIYVAEHAPAASRGRATGWIQVAAGLGLILALGVILITRKSMGEDAFAAWGWRIPFFFSFVLLAISIWIRMQLAESPAFRRIQAEGKLSRSPLREAFGNWENLRLVLIALFALMMGQGVIWYTAQFYTQFFLEKIAKVDPATVNLLIIIVTAISAPLYMAFAIVSDRIGRKPVMLFGLGLAAISFFPGFMLLTRAVNPELAAAAAKIPVIVEADPGDCSFQFDLIGKSKFITSCDIARSTLTSAGVPYRTINALQKGSLAVVHVGQFPITSFDGRKVTPAQLKTGLADFKFALLGALRISGYPPSAPSDQINTTGAIAILLVFLLAATALYGPQAATLVELFPTRIRYTALSLPYHIGNGWFGGLVPATAFAIVAATGNTYAGLWYPVVIAGIAFFVALFFLPETRGKDIEN